MLWVMLGRSHSPDLTVSIRTGLVGLTKGQTITASSAVILVVILDVVLTFPALAVVLSAADGIVLFVVAGSVSIFLHAARKVPGLTSERRLGDPNLAVIVVPVS